MSLRKFQFTPYQVFKYTSSHIRVVSTVPICRARAHQTSAPHHNMPIWVSSVRRYPYANRVPRCSRPRITAHCANNGTVHTDHWDISGPSSGSGIALYFVPGRGGGGYHDAGGAEFSSRRLVSVASLDKKPHASAFQCRAGAERSTSGHAGMRSLVGAVPGRTETTMET